MNAKDLTPTAIRGAAHVILGSPAEEQALFDAIGNARIVLIGEASHGTQEFYRQRAEITKRLIAEQGFEFVAVEADWPDAYRVNRWVKGRGTDLNANEALSDFKRFPAWMWRNTEIASFIQWLRQHNKHTQLARCGFYGLDLYSMYTSIDAVIDYLDEIDPYLAEAARARYACFEEYEREAQLYGYATALEGVQHCQDQAVQQLIDMQRHTAAMMRSESPFGADEAFYAEQNARLVRNAESYYRAMYRSNAESWNQRDRHMAETLDALLLYHERQSPLLGRRATRAVVWAHNSHIGDARATEMSRRGEINIGSLARERYGVDVFAIGFTTHTGSVTAAREWGGPAECRTVRPGLPGSYEALFHKAGMERFLLLSRDLPDSERLERAIGVIYKPETERWSHYFGARIAHQFDAIIHLEETHALRPLEPSDLWRRPDPEDLPTATQEATRA